MEERDEIINIPNEDLLEQDKESLVALIRKLIEQNQTSLLLIKERDTYIHQKITTKWSWEEIRNEFEQFNDLSRALSFLDKILKEKAVCGSKECPVFPSLLEVDKKLFVLRQKYDSIFDPETAKKRFSNNLNKLKRWDDFYWKIRLLLLKAYHEIKQIGIPNEVKNEKIISAQDFSLITIDALGKAGIQYRGQTAQNVDKNILDSQKTLMGDDPELQEDLDIFKRKAFLEEVKARKKQKMFQEMNKKRGDAIKNG